MIYAKREIGIYSDRDPWGKRVGFIEMENQRFVRNGQAELDAEEKKEVGELLAKLDNGEEI